MDQTFGGAPSIGTNSDGLLSHPWARSELFFDVEAKTAREEGIAKRAAQPTDAVGAADRQDGEAIVRRMRVAHHDASDAAKWRIGVVEDGKFRWRPADVARIGAAVMLRLAQGTRVFMAVAPIDMRRSFDGLCAAVTETLQANPLDGHLFLFRGKRSDRIKALIWDRNGLAIWYKRLERGRYRWPSRDAVSIEITEQELSLLLDGVDFTRIRRLPAVHAQAAL